MRKDEIKIGDLVQTLVDCDDCMDFCYGLVVDSENCPYAPWHEKKYKIYWIKTKIFTFEKYEHLHKAKLNEN